MIFVLERCGFMDGVQKSFESNWEKQIQMDSFSTKESQSKYNLVIKYQCDKVPEENEILETKPSLRGGGCRVCKKKKIQPWLTLQNNSKIPDYFKISDLKDIQKLESQSGI